MIRHIVELRQKFFQKFFLKIQSKKSNLYLINIIVINDLNFLYYVNALNFHN